MNRRLAVDLHEMPNLILSEKIKQNKAARRFVADDILKLFFCHFSEKT